MGPIKFLYNSKFDLTAKSLVTNTVVITRVLCITIICNISCFDLKKAADNDDDKKIRTK